MGVMVVALTSGPENSTLNLARSLSIFSFQQGWSLSTTNTAAHNKPKQCAGWLKRKACYAPLQWFEAEYLC